MVKRTTWSKTPPSSRLWYSSQGCIQLNLALSIECFLAKLIVIWELFKCKYKCKRTLLFWSWWKIVRERFKPQLWDYSDWVGGTHVLGHGSLLGVESTKRQGKTSLNIGSILRFKGLQMLCISGMEKKRNQKAWWLDEIGNKLNSCWNYLRSDTENKLVLATVLNTFPFLATT